MADFDKYSDANLEIPQNEGPTSREETPEKQAVLASGIDTETCAKICIENGDCADFTACFDPQSHVKLECMMPQIIIKRNYVRRRAHCNTYLLSPKSEFNSLNRRVFPSDAKDTMEESEKALISGEYHQHSSIGIFKFFSLSMAGIAFGCLLVIAYRNQYHIKQFVHNYGR